MAEKTDNSILFWATAMTVAGVHNPSTSTCVDTVVRMMAAASGRVEVVSPAAWPDRPCQLRHNDIDVGADMIVAPFVARHPSWDPSHWVLAVARRADRSVFVLDPWVEEWMPSVAMAGAAMMSKARAMWPHHAQSWAIYYPVVERLDGLQTIDDTAFAVCEWARRIIGTSDHVVSPQGIYVGIESAVDEWKTAMKIK